jgi:TRAP-type C4-dicarboxylate transport system permease small subunit
MSHAFRRYYEIGIYLLIILLSGVLVKEGWFFTQLGENQTSATMPFQMSVIHAAIFIMSAFLLLYSIVKIIRLIRNEEDFNSQMGGGEL